jgi:large subunit ribosomal protein L10e
MASLRPGRCYKRIQRAYTRKSKYKNKAFIKSTPAVKIIKFDMGDLKKKFKKEVNLISKEALQLRQNAVESSRLVINRILVKNLNKNYHLKIRIYPHHVLRENKMLTGAGADRMQSGMQRAFGKPVAIASRIKKGQPLFSVYVDEKDVNIAKEALKKAIPRLPCKCSIESKSI